MEGNDKELGLSIARLRLSQDLKQSELAYEAGVSHRTLQRLEAGEAVRSDGLLRVIHTLGRSEAVMAALDSPTLSPYEQLSSQGLSIGELTKQTVGSDSGRKRRRVRRSRTTEAAVSATATTTGKATIQWPEDKQ